MKKVFGTLTLCGLFASAFGATYTWVPGSTDWGSPSSYTGVPGGGVPGEGDVVVIPSGCTISVSANDTTAWNRFDVIAQIRPTDDTSVLEITLEQGETKELRCCFSCLEDISRVPSVFPEATGFLVKKGSGTLLLTAVPSALVTARVAYFDNMTVEGGTLKMPQALTGQAKYYVGAVAVSNAATFVVAHCTGTSTSLYTTPQAIFGEGMITNESTATCLLFECGSGQVPRKSVFGGVISSNISLTHAGNMHLTGVANKMSAVTVSSNYGKYVDGSLLGIAKFGLTANQASSIGTRQDIWMTSAYGGRMLYLGTGEETKKYFTLAASGSYPNGVDAGATGGLSFTYDTAVDLGSADYRGDFYLTGSNTTVCTIAGAIKAGANNVVSVSKYGTGTWKMKKNSGHTNGGLWAVRNGTLQFDSLAERGTVCAFGTAENTFEIGGGTFSSGVRVPYAFVLGGYDPDLKTNDTHPVFEYVGTENVGVSTRPAVLDGEATIRNSGNGIFRFSGVSALSAGEKTLILDGDGVKNELSNVTDDKAAGKIVSVVKRGSGTWSLSGTNTFSGDLKVEEGTLVVNAQKHYSWFKFNVIENFDMTKQEVYICDFGFYDANGVRRNAGLVNGANAPMLEPGEIGIGAGMAANTDVYKLCDGTKTSSGGYNYGANFDWRGTFSAASPCTFVMRLPIGSPSIASYDFVVNQFSNWAGPLAPRAWTVEGSVDGLNWDTVASFAHTVTNDYSWQHWSSATSGGGAAASNPDLHTTGFKLDRTGPAQSPEVLTQVRSVSVAKNATLKLSEPGALELSSLEVAADGNGIIDGFALAESGTLNVTGVVASGEINVAIDLSKVVGAENLANWGVSIDGKIKRNWQVKVTADGVKLVPPGILLIVR